MDTAIVGKFKGQYYVFAAWDTKTLISRENQRKVSMAVKDISLNHPDIPLFHYVVSNKLLLRGDVFSYVEWDDIVISSETHFNRHPQQWENLNYYDTMLAAKKAKQEIGL